MQLHTYCKQVHIFYSMCMLSIPIEMYVAETYEFNNAFKFFGFHGSKLKKKT